MSTPRSRPMAGQQGLAETPRKAAFLHDCLFNEMMPPTFAWAYRRLLNAGQGRDGIERIG
jgi:hypothetical protein